MQKVKTGRTFTVEEYRKGQLCLQCGVLINSVEAPKETIYSRGKRYNVCDYCKSKNHKRCKACKILLREGLHYFYSYDNTENIEEKERKKEKTDLMEFATAEFKDIKSDVDGLCKSCVGFEKRIKNKCFMCSNKIDNNVDYFLQHGNSCQECLLKINRN